jgi:hypothetical protein
VIADDGLRDSVLGAGEAGRSDDVPTTSLRVFRHETVEGPRECPIATSTYAAAPMPATQKEWIKRLQKGGLDAGAWWEASSQDDQAGMAADHAA